MSPRILIAEDDAYLRALFVKAFRTVSYDVTAVGDGDAVVDYLNHHLPDILVMDIGLPGPDGLDILKYVRRHEHYMKEKYPAGAQHVNVILVTGNAQAKHSPEALLADAFVLKPVNIRELIQLARHFDAMPQTA